ncbi:terminase small subunit [Comamonas sp. J-3]|uniref:terminase small subunit n=1 Tax=Comamonas trifloxystrobinivorans TaxID=3350256 RepID=UPI003727C7F2
MAKEPARKKPAPRKTPTPKPAAPKKKVPAGKVAPAPKAKPVPAVKKAVKAKAPVKRAPQAKKPATPRKDALQLGLTPKQQRFVDEYLVDLNGAQAAIRAGYSPDTAKQMASENLSKPYLQLAIAEARKVQQERTQINADAVLQQAWMIAFADERELVEVRVGCCRHCWGEGFKYQRTVAEFNKDRERFDIEQRMGKVPKEDEFDQKGGIGYDPLQPPHPSCTECRGDGYARDVIKDTRYLSPAAAQLYAGVKRTKDGMQVLMHSKEAFAEKLWKHLGLYQKDNQQKTDPLAALLDRIAGGSGNGFAPVAVDPERETKPSSLPVRDDMTGLDED